MHIKINHLQHVSLPIADITASQAFYERIGFKNVMSSTFNYNDQKGKVAMMKPGDIIIELYQMPEP